MEKIDHPVLNCIIDTVDEIRATQDQIAKLDDQIVKLKKRLKRETLAVRELDRGSTRLDIARYAYWHLPEVPVVELTFAVTKRRYVPRLLDWIGPHESEVACSGCGEHLPVASREELKRLLVSTKSTEQAEPLCNCCRKIRAGHSRSEDERRERDRQARCAELRAMPYEEYRRTPDWRHSRDERFKLQRFIHGPRSPIICEACSKTHADIDAYHTSLEHLGREGCADLVVLCPGCRDALRSRGALAA